MKKLLVFTSALMLAVSTVFAADFSPTLLKLSAPPFIHYDFNGLTLEIPVQVSGTPAGIIFCVYTRGQAVDIPKTINGYLGWHHVNKVDTCIYYSTLKSVSAGANVINWDGRDQDDGIVNAGDYTYYIWAYDNQGAKQQMSKFLESGWGFDYETEIQAVDESGLPMSNPVWYRADSRWKIGSDPFDESLLETANIILTEGWERRGDPAMHPTDFNYFYISVANSEEKQGSIQKLKWVPGGECEIRTDWGEKDGYATIFGTAGGGSPGICTDGIYLYSGDENHVASTEPDADFYIYDFDGIMVTEVDLTPWWSSPETFEATGMMNGGPNNFAERNGKVFLNCHGSCLNQMVNPARYLETGVYDDFYVWSNGNGDYVLDHNFDETAERPWVCHDYMVPPYKYSISPDANLFTIVNAYDVGAVTFGLLAPDGTGLGYFAFAGETAGWKKGELFIDDDTPFDGMYLDDEQTAGPHYNYDKDKKVDGIFFLGHDSITGVITSGVGVAETAPAAFTVAQNSPNPFNPSTTISFDLADAGNVTVEVYNVAGQKVDTVTDGFMDTGSHSVIWDASGFSAGVYFYTVKSGGFSKTMKMTIVK